MNKNLHIIRKIYRNLYKTKINVLGNGYLYLENYQVFPSKLNVFICENKFNDHKKTINYELRKEISNENNLNKLMKFEKISNDFLIHEIDHIKLNKILPLLDIDKSKIIKIQIINRNNLIFKSISN